MELTKQKLQKKIEDVLKLLDQVNTLTEELENTLNENEIDASKIFNDIRQNRMHDINGIMMEFDKLGVLDKLPDAPPLHYSFGLDEETIRKAGLKMEAANVIQEAIKVGVLDAAGSERVYVCIDEDGTEENSYWEPVLLDEAASSLVETGNVEMLKKAVEEAKEKKKNMETSTYFNAGGFGLYLTVSEEADMVRKYVEVSGRSEELKNMDERDIVYSILGGKELTDEYNMKAIIPIVKKPSQEVIDAMKKEKPDGAVLFSEKQGTILADKKKTYTSEKKMAGEFRRKYGNYLPKSFDYIGRLVRFDATEA